MTRKSSRRSPVQRQHLRNPAEKIWQAYVKRLREYPQDMPLILKDWEPEATCVKNWLPLLLKGLSPAWWKKRDVQLRKDILSQLIRVDNGRGMVTSWLAAIIRRESDPWVLSVAAWWQRKDEKLPPELLEAWMELTGQGNPALRRIAWQVILGARVSPEWETRRATLLLKHLSWESNPAVLSVMSGWEPSADMGMTEMAREIRRQWLRKLEQMGEFPEDRTTTPDRYISLVRIICQGWLESAAKCPDDGDIIQKEMGIIQNRMMWLLPYMEDANILESITSRRIFHEDDRRQMMVRLCNEYLVNPRKHVRKMAWEVLGKLWEDEKQISRPDETPAGRGWDHCISALLGEESPEVLKEVVCPPGLTEQQQKEWHEIWMKKLGSPELSIFLVAGSYLLESGTLAPCEEQQLKEILLKWTGRIDHPAKVGELLRGIRRWQLRGQKPQSMFVEVWSRIGNSPRDSIRLEAIDVLGKQLAEKIKQGESEGEDGWTLAAWWLSALRKETAPEIITTMGGWQSTMGRLPEPIHQECISTWKEKAQDPACDVRKSAWSVLCQVEEGMGEYLTECLKVERSVWVLLVMSRWGMTSREAAPPRFWEAWEQCFDEGWVIDPFQGRPWCTTIENIGQISRRWLGQNAGDDARMWCFWNKLVNYPDYFIRVKAGPEWSFLQLMAAADGPPEVFRQKMGELSGNKSYELGAALNALGEMEKDGRLRSSDSRRNLIIAATVGIESGDTNACQRGQQIFKNICRKYADASACLKTEWKAIEKALMKSVASGREIGGLVKHLEEAFAEEWGWKFREALEKKRQDPRTRYPHLLELALWKEAGILMEAILNDDSEEKTNQRNVGDMREYLLVLRKLVRDFGGKMTIRLNDDPVQSDRKQNRSDEQRSGPESFLGILLKTIEPKIIRQLRQLWSSDSKLNIIPDVDARRPFYFQRPYDRSENKPGGTTVGRGERIVAGKSHMPDR